MNDLQYDIEKRQQLVRVFDHPLDFADYLDKIPECFLIERSGWRNNRYERYTKDEYKKAIQKIRDGDLDIARQAEKLIKEFDENQLLSIGVPQPESAIIGGHTVMPLFEAGIPECMLTPDQSNMKGINTPLNIYFDRYGSIGLSYQQALNRGLACMAFVIAMSQFRPVNLYVIAVTSPEHNGLYGALVRIPSNPIDLARIGWLMTATPFYEMLTWVNESYQYVRYYNNKSPKREQFWSPSGPYGGCIQREDLTRGYRYSFGLSPDDFILYGTQTTAPRIHDENAANNPIGWIKAMMKIHAFNSYSQSEIDTF